MRVPVCLFADGIGGAGQQLSKSPLGHADGHRSAVPPGDEGLEQDAARFQVLRDGAVSDPRDLF